MVEIFGEDVELPNCNVNEITQWIDGAVENENLICGDLNVIFCSDEYLLKINIDYLKHNYLTDIITFDYSNNNIISGDLFISVDRVEDNAKQFGVSFDIELSRVIIHGVLHLAGYNDKSDDEKREMRKLENYYLERL